MSDLTTTLISYPHFSQIDIRVAVVINAQEIEGADKLLKLTLDVGDSETGGLGERTVAAGIKEWYQPADLVGRQVIYLSNLEPRTLRGVESQGMILAADDDRPVILQPQIPVKAGTKIR